MTRIGRPFRLARDSSQFGLEWSGAGPSLAGVQLLTKHAGGFVPRPADEVEQLAKAAYGATINPMSLAAGLAVIARALNEDQIGRAMVAALQLRLPEVDRDAATKLGATDASLTKFDPNQPRDNHGRWTDENQSEASVAEAGRGRDLPSNTRPTSSPPDQPPADNQPISPALGPEHAPVLDGRMRNPAQQVTTETLTPAAYNGVYHDVYVSEYADELRSRGEIAETSVRLRMGDGGPSAIIDILAYDPKIKYWYGVEVKTGDRPGFTPFQVLVYAHTMLGGSVQAVDMKAMGLGLIPNTTLPPIPIWLVYQRNMFTDRVIRGLDPNKMARYYRGFPDNARKVSITNFVYSPNFRRKQSL